MTTKRPVRGWRSRAVGALLAVAAAAMIAGPAWAQVDACERPDRPDVPDGHGADYREMRYAEAEVDVYAEEMAAYLDCLREEQRDAAEEEAGVRGQWEEAADAFGPAERRVRRVGAAAGRATPEPAGGACPFAATGGFRDKPSQEEP